MVSAIDLIFMDSLDSLWTENWITSIGARLGIVQTDADDVHGYNQTNMMMSNQQIDSDAFNASKKKQTDENIDISLLTRYNMEEDSSVELGYSMKTRSPNLISTLHLVDMDHGSQHE